MVGTESFPADENVKDGRFYCAFQIFPNFFTEMRNAENWLCIWYCLQILSTNHAIIWGYCIIKKTITMKSTHWGCVTHISISKLTIIGLDNGLSPGWRLAIIWTNAGMLLIGPLRTNFSEILIISHTFSFRKMHFKMSSGKWRPACLSLYILHSTSGVTSVIAYPR